MVIKMMKLLRQQIQTRRNENKKFINLLCTYLYGHKIKKLYNNNFICIF